MSGPSAMRGPQTLFWTSTFAFLLFEVVPLKTNDPRVLQTREQDSMKTKTGEFCGGENRLSEWSPWGPHHFSAVNGPESPPSPSNFRFKTSLKKDRLRYFFRPF